MKSRLKYAGLGAALATATASLQAAVKVNEYVSLDGYATAAGVVNEGTAESNGEFFNSGRVYDSAVLGANATYKDFTGRLSVIGLVDAPTATPTADRFDTFLLDAYVTYKIGAVSITGGQYLGWLGYESFHSVNNAFISFSEAFYASPYSTGGKVEYAGDGFSTGISVRDSQTGNPGTNSPFEGDGEFSDDIGYEAYVLFTGVKDLTLFAGVGFEDVYSSATGNEEGVSTYDIWASYAFTESFSLAAEYAALEEDNNGTWLLIGTYKVNEPLSVSGRVTGSDGDNNTADVFGYGVASTYTFSPNFSLKGEIVKSEYDLGGDTFSYAIQGIFKF